ncbi:hypothetical protein H257_13203 [Aphanomyces astaci]|uniref:Uncharacterized protein n=1 Tax=Aphanomyces astaci TaxID=112090 RepID=W4FVK6_APHAT|nr:hypothetical protein H257_13203 [Aphanomyces astaci]ETV71540.1 hypothetical protein H257_13203 [Aphanomyces astaci]|eukprot:XP_009838973.1 hypothetical protein H257_13203 [Aphanomyces astaci]
MRAPPSWPSPSAQAIARPRATQVSCPYEPITYAPARKGTSPLSARTPRNSSTAAFAPYLRAKIKWRETSQTRKALNRAVAIQRTNGCTVQLRHLLRIHEAVNPTGAEYLRLAHMVEWPK